MERLSDLDELIIRCRTEASKEYIAEAIACYRGSAFRACIVSTWVAIVFDIVDKLSELSNTGNAKARELLDSFENYQSNIDRGDETSVKPALEFERNLLERAHNDLQIIDAQQFRDLSRLREDRHRCAHPTFQRLGTPYKPTAELARTHLRAAIEHLLQHPPVQGKAAIQEIKHLASSEYFPKTVQGAKDSIEQSPFSRPTAALVRGVIDDLTFSVFDRSNPVYAKPNIVAVIGAFCELHRNEAAPRLGRQLNKLAPRVDDKTFRIVLTLFGVVDDLWSEVDEPVRLKAKEFVKSSSLEQFLSVVRFIEKIGPLGQNLADRLSALAVDELAQVIEKGVKKSCVPAAIEHFSTVGSWPRANSVADAIVLPLVNVMTKEDVQKIIKAPEERNADLPGASGYNAFLKLAFEENLLSEEEIRELRETQGIYIEYILGTED